MANLRGFWNPANSGFVPPTEKRAKQIKPKPKKRKRAPQPGRPSLAAEDYAAMFDHMRSIRNEQHGD